MKYPNKSVIVAVLGEVAHRAAMESNCEHPEDIANAMLNAIEHGAVTITVLTEVGLL